MNNKQIKGKKGEKNAIKYLEKKGYKIICENFRCMKGEIDIIAYDNDNIIFVEVKTRANKKFGEAKEAVDKRKIKHIYEAAKYFMYVNNIEESYARIDVIEVYIEQNENIVINHIKQVI